VAIEKCSCYNGRCVIMLYKLLMPVWDISVAFFQGMIAPTGAWDLRRRTEIIPGKHSDTRIKPLPLTNGNGRYITVTPERTLVSVGEWPLNITVITPETVAQRQFNF
jgi:hypothetical protein